MAIGYANGYTSGYLTRIFVVSSSEDLTMRLEYAPVNILSIFNSLDTVLPSILEDVENSAGVASVDQLVPVCIDEGQMEIIGLLVSSQDYLTVYVIDKDFVNKKEFALPIKFRAGGQWYHGDITKQPVNPLGHRPVVKVFNGHSWV